MDLKNKIMTISLNPKLFDTDIEQAPIRAGFGEGN